MEKGNEVERREGWRKGRREKGKRRREKGKRKKRRSEKGRESWRIRRLDEISEKC